MSRYTDQFDRICGDCAGIDMLTITAEDVRNQARLSNESSPSEHWNEDADGYVSGPAITDEDVEDAIRGLAEYHEQISED